MRRRSGKDLDLSEKAWRNIWSTWIFSAIFSVVLFGVYYVVQCISNSVDIVTPKLIVAYTVTMMFICSLLLYTTYVEQVGHDIFFYADFPKSRQGKILSVLLLPWIGITLISWRNMRIWQREHEELHLQVQADAKLSAQSKLDDKTIEVYREFRDLSTNEVKTFAVQDAEANLQSALQKVEDLEMQLLAAKEVVNQARLDHQAAEDVVVPKLDEQQIEQEYAAISKIRGVVGLEMKDQVFGMSIHALRVTFTVQIEQDGKTYYIGDYRLDLHPTRSRIRLVKTGIWSGHKDFHNREYTVMNTIGYMLLGIIQQRGFVAAVETASAMLHTFTDSQLQSLDEAYFTID